MYYILLQLAVALGIVYRDGITFLLLDNNHLNEMLEILFNLMCGVGAMLLCNRYLQMDQYLPKVKKYAIWLVVISVILYFTYLITEDFLIFIITDIVILMIISIYTISALYLFNKSI